MFIAMKYTEMQVLTGGSLACSLKIRPNPWIRRFRRSFGAVVITGLGGAISVHQYLVSVELAYQSGIGPEAD
jgi:hypothetical protein